MCFAADYSCIYILAKLIFCLIIVDLSDIFISFILLIEGVFLCCQVAECGGRHHSEEHQADCVRLGSLVGA